MIEYLDPAEFRYDAVVGTSVGSIGALILSSYPLGKEKEAVNELQQLWRDNQV